MMMRFLVGTDLEEGAKSDMGEVVMGAVPATLLVRLLPEVQQLMLQLSNRTQVQNVVPCRAVIQDGVVHVRQKPGEEDGRAKGMIIRARIVSIFAVVAEAVLASWCRQGELWQICFIQNHDNTRRKAKS